MQLQISVMDHSQMDMNHEMTMQEDSSNLPCSDCITASENYALKDSQVFNMNLSLFSSAIIPEKIDANGLFTTEYNPELLTNIELNSNAPPLIGSVILRV
ncbi:hypothetical protein KJ652_04915 [Patescibacteria group bacterium]|nr:hypothetical protein [Patescibacteria group bacterium]